MLRLTDDEWARIDAIEGWLFRDEADLLLEVGAAPWCEVGAWKGRATNVLARLGHGYVVDHFRGSSEHPEGTDTRAEFNANTTGLRITVHRAEMTAGAERVPRGLRLLFLDAEHTYEATMRAFTLYAPLVAPDGVVVFHDAWDDDGYAAEHEDGPTPWPGVTRFVRELRKADAGWVNVRNAARCAVFARG